MCFLTWAAAINGIAVILATVEAVVMGRVTNLIISLTFHIIDTHGERLAFSRLSVTEVLSVTVTVIITLAGVVSQVTDGGRVLTVGATVVTSLTFGTSNHSPKFLSAKCLSYIL